MYKHVYTYLCIYIHCMQHIYDIFSLEYVEYGQPMFVSIMFIDARYVTVTAAATHTASTCPATAVRMATAIVMSTATAVSTTIAHVATSQMSCSRRRPTTAAAI